MGINNQFKSTMEANDPCEAALSSSSKDEKSSGVEYCVDDLLEECWFFGNLLVNPKPVINTFTRCYSDPCPSSSTIVPLTLPNKLVDDDTISSSGGDSRRRGLVRAPSLPMNIGREEDQEGQRDEKLKHKPKDDKVQACVDKREGNCQRKHRRSNITKVLTRTQTLPPCMRNVVVMNQEGESDGKMTKSGRQASLNLADILPPRHDRVNLFFFY